MQIRQATMEDIDAIESLWKEMAIFHQKFDSYFTLTPEAEANHRIYMTGLLQDDSIRIYVADEAGCVHGYLMAEVKAYPPIYVQKNYGHIGAISVTSSARRQGVGRCMLDAALDWFREQDLQLVECSVAVANPVSQRFWKSVGFRGFMEKHVLNL